MSKQIQDIANRLNELNVQTDVSINGIQSIYIDGAMTELNIDFTCSTGNEDTYIAETYTRYEGLNPVNVNAIEQKTYMTNLINSYR